MPEHPARRSRPAAGAGEVGGPGVRRALQGVRPGYMGNEEGSFRHGGDPIWSVVSASPCQPALLSSRLPLPRRKEPSSLPMYPGRTTGSLT